MSVRLVWVELGELIAISKLITDNSRKIPNDPSGHINTGIDAFIHDIANTAAWNTRTLISTFSELGENFLLFAGEEFEDMKDFVESDDIPVALKKALNGILNGAYYRARK